MADNKKYGFFRYIVYIAMPVLIKLAVSFLVNETAGIFLQIKEGINDLAELNNRFAEIGFGVMSTGIAAALLIPYFFKIYVNECKRFENGGSDLGGEAPKCDVNGRKDNVKDETEDGRNEAVKDETDDGRNEAVKDETDDGRNEAVKNETDGGRNEAVKNETDDGKNEAVKDEINDGRNEILKKIIIAGRKNYVNYFALGAVLAVVFNFIIARIIVSTGFNDYETVEKILFNGKFAMRIICLGILVPVCEELLFRGITFNRLMEKLNLNQAVVLSALLFGIYHMNLIQFVYAFIMGLIMGVIIKRERNLCSTVSFHAGANMSIIILQLLMQYFR